MSITFKKKVSSTPNVRLPAGTRLNSNGTLLLTSSGISSLDTFIGGGVPVGSLLVIYEDPNCTLSDSILRCYLSEGVYSKHDLCVAALRTDPTENLPTKEENLPPSDNRTEDENEKMKIAWRYENLSSLDSSSASSVHYDLQSSKPIPNELLEQVKIHKLTWDDYARSQPSVSYRNYLLQTLRTLLTTDYSSQQAEKRILRIGIQSLSLSLFDDQSGHHFDELFAFLYHLRILLRTSLATCVITLHEKSKLFETVADLVFELKLSHAIHSDYVAFCQLIKLPRLNTIQPFIPDTWDVGIKLIKHRKNLTFEKYSIPPDLSAEASREDKNKSLTLKFLGLGVCSVDVMMDEEEDDTSAFRQHLFDLSIKRSNSSPALPLLVNTAENDMQFDDVDFCDSKLRRHSSSFSSHQSRLSRFAHIMKNELTNPIVDEASQERDLHDNLKMSISFTDLAVGDEQQPQQPAHSIDSRRSSVNSSDSSNLCYSSSPSPSTPARPCAVVSNQRQCYSPALQQQVAPFQCYLASPPSRSQSPIGMMTNNNNNSSSAKITSFPPNLKRKQGDDSSSGANHKKSRIASDNESLFGPTNSPESPSPGLVESNSNLLTTQQSLNLLSSIPPSLSSSSSTSNGNDNTHFKPIQHPDNDLFPPPNSPSICPSPTNSTCSSSSLTFTPISPASTTSSSSSSFLLLPANLTRAAVVSSLQSSGLIVPSATKHFGINTNCSKMKLSNKSHFQRDRSLDEASSLQPLSVILPRPTTMQEKSDSPTTEEQFFFSSDDNTSTIAQ